jgi:hypothetical protein
MSITSISQSNGADLLNLYSQSVGLGAATAVEATAKVLKTSLAQAALSAAEVLNSEGDSGAQLNVYA